MSPLAQVLEWQIDFHVVGTAEFSLFYDPLFYDNYRYIDGLAPLCDFTGPVAGTIHVSDNGFFGTIVGLFDNNYTVEYGALRSWISGIDYQLTDFAAPAEAYIGVGGGAGSEFVFQTCGWLFAYCTVSATYRVTSVDWTETIGETFSVVPEPSTWSNAARLRGPRLCGPSPGKSRAAGRRLSGRGPAGRSHGAGRMRVAGGLLRPCGARFADLSSRA
jgi:hypothetical protein